MDWYCALTGQYLKPDSVDESFESIMPYLKEKIFALYKALLLYQMKSVCSYYRHQGVVFLRGLANWDDWDADLKTVTNAEDALLKDWGQYDQLHARNARKQLVKRSKEIQGLLQQICQDIGKFIAL